MNIETFKSIETQFISRIIDLRKCQQPPIILVGNKSDLLPKFVLSASSSFSPKAEPMTESNDNRHTLISIYTLLIMCKDNELCCLHLIANKWTNGKSVWMRLRNYAINIIFHILHISQRPDEFESYI